MIFVISKRIYGNNRNYKNYGDNYCINVVYNNSKKKSFLNNKCNNSDNKNFLINSDKGYYSYSSSKDYNKYKIVYRNYNQNNYNK